MSIHTSLATLDGLKASLVETQAELAKLHSPQWETFAKLIGLTRALVPGYTRTLQAQERYLKARIAREEGAK